MAQLEDNVQRLLNAFRSRDTAALQALAEQGVHLESRDREGCTVLHLAATAGEPGTVQWILEAGADLHVGAGAGPWEGQDPLMRAAASGHGGVVDLLMAAGAEATATDARGRRAIDLAHGEGHAAIVQRLRPRSGGPPRQATELESEAALSRVHDRGLGREDGDDVCILVRAAPRKVAEAWRQRIDADTWLPDAYGTDVRVVGLCFLVFRFQGHPWTLLRAAHESPNPGFDTRDAAYLSERLDAETLFLRHEASVRGLACHHYVQGQRRWATELPSTLESSPLGDVPEPGFTDEINDTFEDRFDDATSDPAQWIAASGFSAPPSSWRAAVQEVDRYLKSLDAYAPSWGRLAGEHHRLEVTGLLPEAFERMDFLAVESL